MNNFRPVQTPGQCKFKYQYSKIIWQFQARPQQCQLFHNQYTKIFWVGSAVPDSSHVFLFEEHALSLMGLHDVHTLPRSAKQYRI